MKFKILLILFLLLLIPFTFAQQYNNYGPEELKTLYNNNLDKVPGFIKSLIGNEIITLHYTSLSGETTVIGIRTESARIISFQEQPFDEPTMNVYVSEDTVEAIKNKQMTLQHALSSERIKCESLRFKTTLKLTIVNSIVTVWSWFT